MNEWINLLFFLQTVYNQLFFCSTSLTSLIFISASPSPVLFVLSLTISHLIYCRSLLKNTFCSSANLRAFQFNLHTWRRVNSLKYKSEHGSPLFKILWTLQEMVRIPTSVPLLRDLPLLFPLPMCWLSSDPRHFLCHGTHLKLVIFTQRSGVQKGVLKSPINITYLSSTCPVTQIGKLWFGKYQFNIQTLLRNGFLSEIFPLTFVTLLPPCTLSNSILNMYFVYIPAFLWDWKRLGDGEHIFPSYDSPNIMMVPKWMDNKQKRD